MTTAPATRCPHRNVTYYPPVVDWASPNHRLLPPSWLCSDCERPVKPAAFVLESQPLPDELALMDFAARAARREREC